MEELSFKLKEFEGPLDLLLHLIRSSKINIYDIPIAEISEQYLAYLSEMEKMDLELTSEFAVVAAELLYIKSKMLLPKEVNEDGEVIDPRSELVAKLLEYQKYKELSNFLDDRQDIGRFSFVKRREKIKGVAGNADLDVSMDELIEAFNNMLERFDRKMPPPKSSFKGIVAREPVSVTDRIEIIKKYIAEKGKKIDFKELFLNTCKTRPQLVATFLGVLEMIKLNEISVVAQKGGLVIKVN